MAIIRHEIPLSESANTYIDPSSYSGSCTWYLEACIQQIFFPGTVTLKDAGANTIGTISLSGGEIGSVVRSALNDEPDAGWYYYELSTLVSTAGVRVVCLQDTGAGALTGTESRIMLGHNIYVATTAYDNPSPYYWKFNSSEWDGSISSYLSGCLTAESGATTTVALQKSTDLSTWTDVTTLTTTSATIDCKQSSSVSLDNGYYYRAAIKTDTGGKDARARGVQLRIVQTGTSVTKLQEFYYLGEDAYFISGLQNGAIAFHDADWSGATNTYKFAASLEDTSDAVALYNQTDEALINGSLATGAKYSLSSGFDFPDNGDTAQAYAVDPLTLFVYFTTVTVFISLASSGTPVNVSGTISASSAAGADAGLAVLASGTASAAVSVSAEPEVIVAVSGMIAVLTGAVAEGEVIITASGLSPPVSSVTGTAFLGVAVSGILSPSSSVSASPGLLIEAAGSLGGISSVSTSPEIGKEAAGSISAVSGVSASGIVETEVFASGTVSAESGTAARAEAWKEASGSSGPSSSVSGTAEVTKETSGSVSGDSSISGEPQVITESEILAAGTVSGESSVSGSSEVEKYASGAADPSSGISAAAEKGIETSGAVSGISSVSGTAEVQADDLRPVSGGIDAESSVSGSPEVRGEAEGTTAAVSSVSGTPEVVVQASAETGAVSSVSGNAVIPSEARIIGRIDREGRLSIAGKFFPGADRVRLHPDGDLEAEDIITGTPGRIRISGAVLHVFVLEEEADLDG